MIRVIRFHQTIVSAIASAIFSVSGIISGIISGMVSGIISGTMSGIISAIVSDIFSPFYQMKGIMYLCYILYTVLLYSIAPDFNHCKIKYMDIIRVSRGRFMHKENI